MEERTYDYSNLEQRMQDYHFSQAKLARVVPMSRTSINLKMNNKVYFTQREIKKFVKY